MRSPSSRSVPLSPNTSGVQIAAVPARATPSGSGEKPRPNQNLSPFPWSKAAARSPAKPPDGGEDRLSELPDEVLVLILQCFDTTAEAARTSVLARRWRSLWALLPKVRFHLRPDGSRIRELLDVPDAPELTYISVTTKGAAADSVTAWLTAAARRLAGGLFYRDMAPDPESDDDEVEDAGDVQLPCFENATTIKLDLCFLGLVLPALGIFTRLTDLSLSFGLLRGPCDLGNIVSSPRCPCLQKLSICYFSGLGNLSIHSESLLQMELKGWALSQVTIVTPILQKLSVHDNFLNFAGDPSEPLANITAPQIVSLVWMASYDPRYFHLGILGQLRELQTSQFLVYGGQFHREFSCHCLRLLQRFQVLHILHLTLIYGKDISDYQYLLGDITVLPQITFLQLDLCNYGHAFGASLFHLLRMCIGLRRLLLVLSIVINLEDICQRQYLLGDITTLPQITFLRLDLIRHGHAVGPSLFHLLRMCIGLRRLTLVLSVRSNFEEEPGCISDQPENWKADELVLGHLEDVRIVGLQGAEHDVVFVQRLLSFCAETDAHKFQALDRTRHMRHPPAVRDGGGGPQSIYADEVPARSRRNTAHEPALWCSTTRWLPACPHNYSLCFFLIDVKKRRK